jgi:hypothetical protein
MVSVHSLKLLFQFGVGRGLERWGEFGDVITVSAGGFWSLDPQLASLMPYLLNLLSFLLS